MNRRTVIVFCLGLGAGAALTALLRDVALSRPQMTEAMPLRSAESLAQERSRAELQRENAALREKVSAVSKTLGATITKVSGSSSESSAGPIARKPSPERKAADLKNVGKSTPARALESLVWAKESTDVTQLAELIVLDPDVRAKAQLLLAEFNEADRIKYSVFTPEQLLAFGWSGLGTRISALQQVTEVQFDDNSVTVYAIVQGDGISASDRRFDFRRTDDGWRWLMPAWTVDGLRAELDGLRAKKDGRK